MLKSYLKQDNVAPHPHPTLFVSIRFRRKISFFKSFTISNRLKKYYFKSLRNCKRRNKGNFTLKSNSNQIMLCGGGGNIFRVKRLDKIFM